jgi:hypothetical protein
MHIAYIHTITIRRREDIANLLLEPTLYLIPMGSLVVYKRSEDKVIASLQGLPWVTGTVPICMGESYRAPKKSQAMFQLLLTIHDDEGDNDKPKCFRDTASCLYGFAYPGCEHTKGFSPAWSRW